jgi:hypothetical protein
MFADHAENIPQAGLSVLDEVVISLSQERDNWQPLG